MDSRDTHAIYTAPPPPVVLINSLPQNKIYISSGIGGNAWLDNYNHPEMISLGLGLG
jgi:hypothetical protein